jgi:hypothetical protein
MREPIHSALGLDPSAVASLPPEALPALLTALAAFQTAVAARLAGLTPVRPQMPHTPNGQAEVGGDDRLTVGQAASLAGLTVEQFYRRKVFRPAIVKLGHRTRRVNERKLRRILAGLGA